MSATIRNSIARRAELLTVHDVAAILNSTPRAIRVALASHSTHLVPPSVKVGRHRRWLRADVARWLARLRRVRSSARTTPARSSEGSVIAPSRHSSATHIEENHAMKTMLARIVPGDQLYDEQEDIELEVVEVFPERGLVQVAIGDETEYRDVVETLAAIRAGRLVRVESEGADHAAVEDEADSDADGGDADEDDETDEDD